VAQKLFSKAVSAAKEHHFSHIYLGSVGIYEAAHLFYEKKGFKKIPKKELPKNLDLCPLDTAFYKGKISSIIENLK